MSPIDKDEWIQQLQETVNTAYEERNNLIAFLARLYPSYIALDKSSELVWQNVVFVDSPAGQLSWHIHSSELHKFKGLTIRSNTWDGHTTEEKYRRLAMLPHRSEG